MKDKTNKQKITSGQPICCKCGTHNLLLVFITADKTRSQLDLLCLNPECSILQTILLGSGIETTEKKEVNKSVDYLG